MIILLLEINLFQSFTLLAYDDIDHSYPLIYLSDIDYVHTVDDKETQNLIKIVDPIVIDHNGMLIIVAQYYKYKSQELDSHAEEAIYLESC